MSFRHLIITRFNIRIDRDSEYVLTDEWMRARLSLFEQYCLPSVIAQTCHDFTWLVLMSKDTATAFRQRMAVLSQKCPMMRILDVQPTTDLSTFYQQLVQQYARDVDYLLTTRLDNDDMLARTYVEDVQRIVAECTTFPMIISFAHGVQLFIQNQVALTMRWPANHFISMIEVNDGACRSVLGYSHIEIAKWVKMRIVKTIYPMWGEIVHSCNVVNDFTPYVRTTPARYAELPFPGEWSMYLRVWHNGISRVRYWLRFRLRTVRKVFARCARILGLNLGAK